MSAYSFLFSSTEILYYYLAHSAPSTRQVYLIGSRKVDIYFESLNLIVRFLHPANVSAKIDSVIMILEKVTKCKICFFQSENAEL